MTRRSIILYWLLLLLPTLAIATAALRLIGYEQERMDRQALSSAGDRAQAVAESIQIAVESVEDEIAQSLERIPPEKLVESLVGWEKSNPIIRNVFVWKPGIGLEYPAPGASATSEEARFITRYAALFSGRIPWRSAHVETTGRRPADVSRMEASAQPSRTVRETEQSNLVQSVRRLRVGQREREGSRAAAKKGGWIPWYVENRLHILGWVRRGGEVYGVELELMTLLSRLVAAFPEPETDGIVFSLTDGEGNILHQAGRALVEPARKPDIAVPLAPQLPHWQVVVFLGDHTGTLRQSGGFMILGSLLLAIFVAAILLGGGMLTWQAHRNMIDAARKTSFVSNVSHELKTPLTSIRMYAELLNEGRIKDAQKTRRYLEVIVAETNRLTRLVNNVLDFSRLEQGRMKYNIEDIDLTAYLPSILETHRLPIQEAGLALQMVLPGHPVTVSADRDALNQVLLNIIDNAVKYAAEGGELVVDLRMSDAVCELRLMDRGPGVPPAHRKSIFEKFHRVDDSLTTRKPGTGLGLSISRRMLRDLGGDLLYEPRDSGGSSFVLVFPQHLT